VEVIQRIYILVLSPIVWATEKLSFNYKKRLIAIGILAFALPLTFLIQFPYRWIFWKGITYASGATFWNVIGSIILIAVIIFAVERGLKPLQSNKLFCIFYFGSAILIFLSCFFHYVGEAWRPLSLTMIFIFPIFYYVIANSRYVETFFKAFSWGLIVGGNAISIASIVLYPPYLCGPTARYMGVNINPANFAIFLLPSIMGCLYIAITSRNKAIKTASLLLIVLPLSLIFLSGTRSVLIAAAFAIFVAVIIEIKKSIKLTTGCQKSKKNLIISSIIIALIIGFIVFLLNVNLGYLFGSLSRFYITGSTMNRITTGRWDLWIETLRRINLWGHDYRADPLIVNGNEFRGAHNFPLEVAYRSGLFAGILYLLMQLYSLGFTMKKIFSKIQVGKEILFSCIVVPSFFIVSMLEWDIRPFTRLYVLCFYLSLSSIMFRRDSVALKP